MAEDIKGLIEKIKKEGIQAAEAKAKERIIIRPAIHIFMNSV